MVAQEKYGQELVHGCGHSDLPWAKLDAVLARVQTFLSRHGQLVGLDLVALALVAAVCGCVNGPQVSEERPELLGEDDALEIDLSEFPIDDDDDDDDGPRASGQRSAVSGQKKTPAKAPKAVKPAAVKATGKKSAKPTPAKAPQAAKTKGGAGPIEVYDADGSLMPAGAA
jgi:hypothetical protein